jgi:hypothetical protein
MGQAWWLTPVIPAAQEADWKDLSEVQGQPGQKAISINKPGVVVLTCGEKKVGRLGCEASLV